jgi:putative endonuclease
MNFLAKLKVHFSGKEEPEHLRRGKLGERAAKKYLRRQGMKFLTANFRSERGEIDLIFRVNDRPFSEIGILHKLLNMSGLRFTRNDSNCLVFIEVKTRSSEEWSRPAAAVNAERRRRLTRTALDYLRLLRNPPVKLRFDIVEVLLLDGAVREVRHLPNTFPMERPYRYG